MFQEFPKCLYQGGLLEGDVKIVLDAEQQKAAAETGFVELGSVVEAEEAPKRRGRPPKAQ